MPMKWYFALNEEGTNTDAGLLARLAVVSAQRHTDLKPHLLYRGQRNRLTDWMRDRGVTVLDVLPQFEPAMQRAFAAGWYPRGMSGHWQRTEICNIEAEDPFVLYTDIDVVFLRRIDLSRVRPTLMACAPDTDPHEQRHFNTGVMLMNVASMRAEYPRLRAAIEAMFADPSNGIFTDLSVYNQLYAGQQDRLDPTLNWKPYWALNPDISIFHFHGPKLDAVRRLFDGTWSWNDGYGRFAGDLITRYLDNYLHYFRVMLDYAEPGDPLRDVLAGLLRDAPEAGPRLLAERDRHQPERQGVPSQAAQPAPEPAAQPKPRQAERNTIAWMAEGPNAWRRSDGQALVVQDRPGVWLASLRQPRPGWPDPMFLTDAQRRIRSFPSDVDARRACDEASHPTP